MYSQDEILSKITKSIIKKIIQNSGGNKKNNKIENIINSLNPDILNAIKKLLIETNKQDPKKNLYRKFKARFIPNDRMFQFSIPSAGYHPYGQSFVDPLVLQGKLYILSQLSNMIMKLSRAAPVRKWIIDVGPTQNQTKYIQQIKRELYNQRVTVEDMMSFKSAPKLLSDFKDMFTFRKGGVSHLDMEVQSLGDASVKVADLEDARRELISLSGIPERFAGI